MLFMEKRIAIFMIGLWLACSVGAATAAWQEDPLMLTLQEAIDLALVKNEKIGMARADLEAAEHGVGEAYAGLMPSLNGYAQYGRNLTKPTADSEIYVPLTPLFLAHGYPAPGVVEQDLAYDNEWAFGLRLEQPLFTSGRIHHAIRMSKAYQRLATRQMTNEEKSVRLTTEETYLGVLLAKETLIIYRQALEQTIRRRDDLQAKYQRGLASDYDLLFAETEVAKQRPKLIAAETSHENALRALKTQIGLNLAVQVVLTDALEMSALEIDEQEAVRLAMAQRDEPAMLQSQIEAQTEEADLYLSNMLPAMVAFGELTYSTQLNDDFWPRDEDDEFKQFTTVGVGLSWPLFDGLQSYHQRRRAQAGRRSSELSLRQTRRGIELEVSSLYHELQAQTERIAANRQSVLLAERTHELARIRYESGLATQLEVNDALLNVTSTKTDLASSIYEYALTRAKLVRAMGQ